MQEYTEVKLNLDQESYFKQQLLKYSVMEEIKIYFNDADFLNDTLFLKFLFDQLTTIPLLANKESAKTKFRQLIHTLPQIVIQSQLASKQETRDQFRKFVVKVFDVALRTPMERTNDKTLKIFVDPSVANAEKEWIKERRRDEQHKQETLDDEEDEKIMEERDRNPKDIERDESIAKLQKRLTELTQIIIMNIEKKNRDAAHGTGDSHNGISSLFNIILKTKHMKDLPDEFTEFVNTVIKIMSLWMERELRDPKQVQKMKRLYMITPVKAIRASLAIANPITLLKGFIILFLAKPFGSRNLIQTITSVMVEIGKTERTLKKSQKDAETALLNIPNKNVRKLLMAKMKGFVQNIHQISSFDGQPIAYFKDVPDSLSVMQYQWPGSPPVDSAIIATLDEEHFKALFEYVKMEKRKKEKNDFIDILGNDEMIDIIRELLPVLYEPLGKLFCKANIGYHFEKIAYVMKKIITVAESGELVEDDDHDLELNNNSNGNGSHVAADEFDDYHPKSAGHTPPYIDSDLDIHGSPNQPVTVTEDKKSNSGNSLLRSTFGWLKPSNLFSSSSTTTTTTTTTQQLPKSQPTTPQTQYSNISNNENHNNGEESIDTRDLKKKFKKDKSAHITMNERLALYEDACRILMERIYDMVHDLVVSDAKMNVNEHDGTIATGLLSQSVSWLLGLLQFLKDEEVDVYTEIFKPLSPNMKERVIEELELVIAYRRWRMDVGDIEENKEVSDNQTDASQVSAGENGHKKDKESKREEKKREKEKEKEKKKQQKSPRKPSPSHNKENGNGNEADEDKDKEREPGPDKPKLVYIPQLTGPFIELIKSRFDRLGDPSKYSLVNLSKIIVNPDDIPRDQDLTVNNNNNIFESPVEVKK
ncbi:hypothetical protein PPL_07624 [Heterostelium album PN500]|uniref:PX domain-containing protein n=1 Tax=Heterostelium pallidum (strain ATCC 26659 / Pp 5 / PN500) TaxID=670386 RepID=D3BGH3_HETP5|nr:hypothetical protein PPL_07624 [Heterostelium album PN500]EFA79573.1 hypothetical protein PPL_07624 [Heterostelium album PN500]|eukprot:XP_020431694.1 hypothetical protein PPL_07624 [Heterostelium album PN500]